MNSGGLWCRGICTTISWESGSGMLHREFSWADGIAGLVSAPRHRTGFLMKITAVIARRGCCSSSLLSSVLGLWINVLLFRRPAFAVLNQTHRFPTSSLFALHRDTTNVLQCLWGTSGPLIRNGCTAWMLRPPGPVSVTTLLHGLQPHAVFPQVAETFQKA